MKNVNKNTKRQIGLVNTNLDINQMKAIKGGDDDAYRTYLSLVRNGSPQ